MLAAGHKPVDMETEPYSNPSFIRLNSLGGPRFLVTVDTEEEFDWNAPFSRDQHGTAHVGAIDRFQKLCDANGVQPAYLIDYPIAVDARAAALLGEYAAQGRAAIGIQLHPWVSPPFDEAVSVHNSFACNLPKALEREKLLQLHAKIRETTGVSADIYRAGRYGAGQYTPQILAELGVAIDSSVRTYFDYSGEGGPNFASAPLNPYWLMPGKVAELPVTTVFNGGLRNMGPKLFNDIMSSPTSRSILSRTGLLERIALTPEGIPVEKAIAGIDCALDQGVGILNFSFHSPSLEPGHVDYVRTPEDLVRFYDWWDRVFAHLALRGVAPVKVSEIKAAFFPNQIG